MKRERGGGYFLGVDGGGTHTLALLVDERGRVVARARAGGLNFFGTDLASARRELRGVMSAVERRLPKGSEIARTVIGCSALFEAATPTEARALCRGILPLARVRVVSDCQTAWFGATLGRAGVVVVAGTGSIVLAGSGRGRTVRVGGWGHLLGDEGSAYWMAREAVRAAIRAEEEGGPATRLGRWVRAYFGVRALTDLVPVIYDAGFTKERLAGLCVELERCGASTDRVYRAICRRAGADLAAQAWSAARRAGLGRRGWTVHLVGGVLSSNRVVRGEFLRVLRGQAGGVEWSAAALAPVEGAAAMALRLGGVRLTREIVANLAGGKA